MLGIEPSKVSVTRDGTTRMVWEPNSDTRIRFESHLEGMSPGDSNWNSINHGEHYHVETKPNELTWGQAKRQGQITKILPTGYTPGSGTGFLTEENFPKGGTGCP